MSASPLKTLRYKLEWAGCEALVRLVPLLPRRACVRLSRLLGAAGYALDGRGRRVALANLQAAFGDRFTPEEREKIARESYQNFARTMLDLFWAPRLQSPETRARFLSTEGAERVRQLRDEKRGWILICVHNANFEWASIACGFEGFEAMVVAESFKNPLLDSIFNSRREVSGQRIIPQENSMIRLLKQVRRGGAAGLLIDLNFPPTQATVIIETFGMDTCVTMLHAVLAQRGKAALIPVEGRVADDGSCHVVFHTPVEFAADASLTEISQACWNFFEPIIRERPGDWMWAYKHWRYQPADARRPYPFYANVSSKFEKLRQKLAGSG